jgi:hypothetical protein
VVTNPDGGSAILSKGFTVLDTIPPVTSAIPRGATYNAPLSVTLQANEPATIRYYDPIESEFVQYSGPINISSDRTLQFYAIDAAGNREATKTETYTIDTRFGAFAVPGSPTNELILPVTSTFTFPAETQAIVVDCQKVNHTLRDSAGNVLPPSDYLKHYVIGPPDTPGSDVITYSGEVTVTCDLAKLYLPESLLAGNYTLEVNYSHFFQFQPPGIQLFQGSISAPSIPVSIAAPISTHFITTEAGAGGSIFLSNSVVSGLVVVKHESEPTFTITPNTGYQVVDVKVDGSSKGAVTSYKFPPVTTDQMIAASFKYAFRGFFPPVDNPEVALNTAKAGQAIPVKWQLKDANGGVIADPSSFMSLTSNPVSCTTFTAPPEVIPELVVSPGSSTLQYLGDGNWQYNWKTLKSYAGCREMALTLRDGTRHTANFKFK